MRAYLSPQSKGTLAHDGVKAEQLAEHRCQLRSNLTSRTSREMRHARARQRSSRVTSCSSCFQFELEVWRRAGGHQNVSSAMQQTQACACCTCAAQLADTARQSIKSPSQARKRSQGSLHVAQLHNAHACAISMTSRLENCPHCRSTQSVVRYTGQSKSRGKQMPD